jgi:hypothetical protein
MASVSATSLSKSLKGGFSVQSKGDRAARKFRVDDEAAAADWVKALRAGVEHRIKYKNAARASARGIGAAAAAPAQRKATMTTAAAAAAGRRRARGSDDDDDDDDVSGGGGSDASGAGDSDRDDDDDDMLPAPPRWFAQYDAQTGSKDKESKWMEISVRWFDQLFEKATQVRRIFARPAVRVAACAEAVPHLRILAASRKFAALPRSSTLAPAATTATPSRRTPTTRSSSPSWRRRRRRRARSFSSACASAGRARGRTSSSTSCRCST